ncbi:unnamed protein product [Protopolystoma xenopodis]|uniref:Large ribosomal subunit protein mL44 dsRNA binding domain-containing protein n=1 Tax=Protopolystoma xenopodis TaxID=117903 RepID=A0A3S5B7B8_9PLAT|nr:unnamed protein product [Protopolystoma xenopodis]
MLACYHVGIYSGVNQIGEGSGETPEVAEQEAACHAVRRLFGIDEDRPPLPLTGPFTPLPLSANLPNPSIITYFEATTSRP